LHHTPFVLTFAYFSRGAVLPSAASAASDTVLSLLDPNLLEQRLCSGTLALALNAQRELCVVQKAGGVPLAPDAVLRAIEVAVPRAKELELLVDMRVRDDWDRRKVEVR
jgi:exosome complex component RRP45